MGRCRLLGGAAVVNPQALAALGRRDLPEDVVADLLRRWSEPHRRYHGLGHLADGLAVLDVLGAGKLERTAFWFHDAVHTMTSPDDEMASAAVAREALAGVLPAGEVDEVCRLVLLTAEHWPDREDQRGARVCDADLRALAAPHSEYVANRDAIRAELPGISDEEWQRQRLAFARSLLARPSIFATDVGRSRWEQRARENLRHEITDRL